MEKSTISPALSKIEIRIEEFKNIAKTIDSIELDIIKAQNHLESLQFARSEGLVTKDFLSDRISELANEAEDEGFSVDYVNKFLKEHDYRR